MSSPEMDIREPEATAAVAIAAALYLVGAILTACALLLAHVDSPAGVLSVTFGALLTAALLFYAAERSWVGLELAFAADLWGVVVIAVLCASSGGSDSPFALIYFFALGHAAAFQPPGRLLLVGAAGLFAYLSPLLYQAHLARSFAAVACVGIVLALMTSAVLHLAIGRMRKQRRQLEGLMSASAGLASTLRQSLMPATLPSITGLELASYFRPMGAGEEVGGDFYDAFPDRERDGCWLIVGDVCGKGAEAAALTGFLRHTTAAYAREGSDPARVLERVNRAMLERDLEGRFATAVLAHLRLREDPPRVELRLAVAGHPAALLLRADGQASELGGAGTLLGILPELELEESRAVLAEGDTLAFYTDGLSEAHAPRRILTPEEMIQELACRQPGAPQQTIDALLGLIDLDGELLDDIALLAVQVKASPVASAAYGISVVGSVAES